MQIPALADQVGAMPRCTLRPQPGASEALRPTGIRLTVAGRVWWAHIRPAITPTAAFPDCGATAVSLPQLLPSALSPYHAARLLASECRDHEEEAEGSCEAGTYHHW